MSVQHFIAATAGHVDHGKSSLIKALTGADPDRLPEEKARGITIDLGFAHLELTAPVAGKTDDASNTTPGTFDVGIVDVPGHEDFVKNMVAGVGSIDVALLVVAADDGWMPQTEEHLQILTYLGVRHAVVALAKIDLAESAEETATSRVREQLRGTAFADSPIVKTSVITGHGLEELQATLASVLAETPPPRDIGKPRLPVDRVFTLRGIGTIVTGTLIGGALHRGQPVVVQPSGQSTRIRSLQIHNRDVESSDPGTRTALNLPDVATTGKTRGAAGHKGVQRGDVITLSELGGPSDTLDVLLEKSARLIGAKTTAARPLKTGARVRIHHGSANFPARVVLFDGNPLLPGQCVPAQLRFATPVFAFVGDRFIVRDESELATLAGGVVLDAGAGRKKFRDESRRTFLETRSQSPDDALVFVASRLTRDHAVPRDALLRKSRFSAAEISAAVSHLVAVNEAVAAGEWIVAGDWWRDLLRRAGEFIQAQHRAHPERIGLPLSELRAAVGNELPGPDMFEALLAGLLQTGFVQAGVAIRRLEHLPALPPHLQAAGARLRSALAAKPFEPPARKELAPDAVSHQALRFLLDTGEAVELGEDVVLLAEQFARAAEMIKKFIHEKGPAAVSDLRQTLQTNRRTIIPLLERLDRDGVTLRQGDKRILKRPSA